MTYRYPGGLVRRTAANTSITGASGVWDLGSQAQAVRTNTWPISGLANPVSGSLRFRKSATAYLSRTPSSTGSQTTWTWSAWVKQSLFGTSGTQWLITSGNSGSISTNYTALSFSAQGFLGNADQLQFYSTLSNSTVFSFESTARFRDPAAWYHVVAVIDTTQATASNRIKLYINGVQITAFALATYPTQNTSIPFINSSSYETRIGSIVTYGSFDGYMAEVNFIDGQALTPASFGQTSPITGVWEPIKYTGTYGTNGFYLSLSDTSSIGKDFSGNGNNWTPNNISTASGSTFDLMRDVPTQYTPQGVTDVGGVVRGNYATFNPLINIPSFNYSTLSNGNLTTVGNSATNNGVNFSTQAVKTGKWYAEFTCTGSSGSYPMVGITDITQITTNGGSPGYTANSVGYIASGQKSLVDGTQSAYGNSFTTNDVIGVAVDADNGAVYFSKNGTFQNSGVPTSGASKTGAAYTYTGGTIDFYISATPYQSGTGWNANFGQQPFAYTPPSGFKSLCTTNLPTPTIGATAANAANKYFDATLITGTAATQVITNAGGFQPDFVWLKSRTNANNPTIYDAIRGVNTLLYPALTNAEQVGTAQLTAFNSNGFTLGASENANDQNGEASVGWQWNAGGSTVTNTAGSISSQVRANTTSGFSVVTWVHSSTTSTIGHGLGVAPQFIILKSRTTAYNWDVGCNSIGWGNRLNLNATDAAYSPAFWNSTAPTSTVFTYAGSGATNGDNMVAYCFTPIAGYSAFGSYTGNGSTDGPFVYTGFRPAFLMIKRTNAAVNWYMFDNKRNTYNAVNLQLSPNLSNAEASDFALDFLSNGFKFRIADSYVNGSGDPNIYMAFAEHPFKNALAR